jgi:hypothetical protein
MKRSAVRFRPWQRLLGPAALLVLAVGCYGTRRMMPFETGGSGGTGVAASMGGTGVAASMGGTGGVSAGANGGGGAGGTAGATGVSGTGGGSSGAPRGSHCAVTNDCANGVCVEGVCCDTACDLKCKSCLKALTDQPDGTCAFVRAGTSHASDCKAADVSTCGFDGTCDGAGACRKYRAGTVCKPQACPGGSSMLTPESTCNGNDSCVTDAPVSCSNYACDSTLNTCRSTCTGDQNCSASAYCNGTTCTPKKSDGALCTAANECRSGTCGGRCCPAGTNCMCPQPTPGNLIKNPGFDTDLSGWTATPNDGSVFWDLTDGLGCPFSGRARLAWAERSGDTSPTISTCIPVQGNSSYDAGIRTVNAAWCDVSAYLSPNCAGSATALAHFAWLGDWHSFQEVVQTPVGAVSAEIVCYAYDKNDVWEFGIDMAFFSPAPGLY